MTTVGSTTNNPIDGPFWREAEVAPLAPSDVIPALIAGGIVSAEEAVTTGITIRETGQSHSVFAVHVRSTPRAYVKIFGPSRGASDGTAARERAIAALAVELPAVAALTAPFLPWTGPRDVIVTKALVGRPAWADEAKSYDPGILWEHLVSRLAGPLAAFHRATRYLATPGADLPVAFAPTVPWGLTLASGDAPPEIWQTPHLAPATDRIAADSRICEGLRAARALWRNICLIHADLKHDNILLIEGGEQVAVLDWEMARVGDPAWDLAALAARLPMTALYDATWGAETVKNTAALISAHSAVSRLPTRVLAGRMPSYMATWLVMAAIQHQSMQLPGSDDAGLDELLEKVGQGFAYRERMVRDLIEALE